MNGTMATPTRTLTLLGTGTSMGVPIISCECPVCTSTNPKNQRTRAGVHVRNGDRGFLIDTGPELRMQMLRENIRDIDAVVYTHAHADHILGLDDLRIFGHYLDRAIPLYCEAPVEQQIRAAFSYAFTAPYPNAHKFAVPNLEFVRIGTEPFELLGTTVRPIRL